MATYTIIPRSTGDGFGIHVAEDDGVRRTLLGFKTEAEAWIARDKATGEGQGRGQR